MKNAAAELWNIVGEHFSDEFFVTFITGCILLEGLQRMPLPPLINRLDVA